MVKFADGPIVEVYAEIAAAPTTVWELVTDINLPARFQDEFAGATWIDDPAPALDARFVGRNRRGERNWETMSWVVAFEPGSEFGWAVSDRDNPGATWTFRLDPIDDGTRLVFHRRVGPGPSGLKSIIDKYPEREEELIAGRDAEHREHMQAVVDGVKRLAEAAPGSQDRR